MTDIGANCVRSDRKVVTSLGVLTWISLFLQRLSTAVLAKPLRPAKCKTWLRLRNETSTKRISRSANAQEERYDVRLQSRARRKPSRQSW